MGESIKTYTYKFDTTKLCEFFNIDGATIYEETFECTKRGYHFPGMLGKKHSEKTKKKMSLSAQKNKPNLHKGGKIIKDGKIFEFDCITKAAKELNLNTSHLSELLSGKRKSHKGWKNAS